MEHHCGQVKVLMHGHMVEKPVFCQGWQGIIYGKTKGSVYHVNTVHADGRFGDFHSWTDLVIFDGWVRSRSTRLSGAIHVRHLVETTKQRILGKVR